MQRMCVLLLLAGFVLVFAFSVRAQTGATPPNPDVEIAGEEEEIEVPRITALDLAGQLGVPGVRPVDVRQLPTGDKIPGSLRLHPGVDPARLITGWDQSAMYVLYGVGPGEDDSEPVAQKLVDLGIDARLLKDGFAGWTQAGMPVQ